MMRTSGNRSSAIAVFMVVLSACALFAPRAAYAQRPPTSVEVINTPTVNARQAGPWAVEMAPGASVNLGNTELNPVPVRIANEGRQAFQRRLTFTIEPGSTQNQISLDVPAGKRLVIEHASARVQGPTGEKYISYIHTVVYTNGGGAGIHWLVLSYQGTFSGIDVFTASQPMHVYAEPSLPPMIFLVTRTGITGSSFAEATISGYLVDL